MNARSIALGARSVFAQAIFGCATFARATFVRATFACAAFAYSVLTAFLCANAAFADTTTEVVDAGQLKKLGAKSLSVRFSDSTDSTITQKAWLQGMDGDKVIWKKPLPIKDSVNTAKTDVICRNGRIEVVSQYPGSAAYTKQTFKWDGIKVSLISVGGGDPSQAQVDRLIKLARTGSMQQLKNFENEEHVIFYSGNYINGENVKLIFQAGRKAAATLAASKKPLLAVQRMQVCFEATVDLVYLEGDESTKKTDVDKWIEAWTAERIGLDANVWRSALKYYAELLSAAGKSKQSATVMTALNSYKG